jgi:EAL domain-containing protein (putative c-di-GMP-specific phosphodiesterase class I)/CheY-like chemotaxis protein
MTIARILVIEDEGSIRMLITDILNSENYEVLEANNGKEGVKLALYNLPDLILCDVMMPEMDGYQVLYKLQQHGVTRRIPFIFLTAKATPNHLRYGMNLGADDYLIKPFDEDELLRAIAARLRKSAAMNLTAHNEKLLETKLQIEADLRQAIGKKQLAVNYQPQINLKTGLIVGAEALMRWHHPQWGNIPPNQFIPLAESTGSIRILGGWILERACEQLKSWGDQGLPPITMAVNVSPRQFNHSDFCSSVEDIITKTGISPHQLELELTEGSVIENVGLTSKRLQRLSRLGIKIAIDDFGTGQASLIYLKKFPFNTLKIDRNFVKNVHSNSENGAISQAIITMARQLNLRVIAEGVETLEEREFLVECGCEDMQGYLFSRPVKADEFKELLKQQN